MKPASLLVGVLLLLSCATQSSAQPAITSTTCQPTPGDQTQGPDHQIPADAPWQARLGPGKELTATAENLAAGASGQRLTLEGRVLDAWCAPLARAALDAWQANADGVYGSADGGGGVVCCYLTASVRTNAQGRFELQTVMPGHYSGAPAHIHVAIAGGRDGTLMTEIQFAGDPALGSDQVNVVSTSQDANSTLRASFDFVLATSA